MLQELKPEYTAEALFRWPKRLGQYLAPVNHYQRPLRRLRYPLWVDPVPADAVAVAVVPLVFPAKPEDGPVPLALFDRLGHRVPDPTGLLEELGAELQAQRSKAEFVLDALLLQGDTPATTQLALRDIVPYRHWLAGTTDGRSIMERALDWDRYFPHGTFPERAWLLEGGWMDSAADVWQYGRYIARKGFAGISVRLEGPYSFDRARPYSFYPASFFH